MTDLVIDFHTHIFPDKIAGATICALQGRSGLVANTDGTLNGLLASMETAGVDMSVTLPIATRVGQSESINNFAVKCNQHPGIIAFGSIHPEQPDWKEELARIVALGLKGVKLHPDYQGFFADDERFFPVFQEIARLGLVVVLHAGLDIGLPEPVHCTPKMSATLLDNVPGLKLVLAHTGGWKYWDDVEKHLLGKDVYLDISFTMNYIGEEQFRRIINGHSADRLLFATDSPWGNQAKDVQRLKALCLPPSLEGKIFHKNAECLLGLNI